MRCGDGDKGDDWQQTELREDDEDEMMEERRTNQLPLLSFNSIQPTDLLLVAVPSPSPCQLTITMHPPCSSPLFH
jgi:hypothetical protein